MRCYDCGPEGRVAVAVCRRCGAALCPDHVHPAEDTPHQVAGTGQAEHGPPARRLTCALCHAAERRQ